MFLSIWEDGVRLRWVASQATADATPASFYSATTGAGGSTAIYVHATGSGDPGSNGKTYKISKRHFGICAGSGSASWRVSNVHTKRQLHNDGSLVIAAPGSTITGCLAEDGTKHNMFIGADCVATDCIAWKCDWADRTNTTAFVAFVSDGRTKSATFRRCIAKMELAKVAAAISGAKAIDGFYAHTSSDGQKWASITFEDCSGYGACTGIYANNATAMTIARGYCEEVQDATAGVGIVTHTDVYAKGSATATVHMRTAYTHNSGTATIEGLRSLGYINTTRGDVYSNAAGSVTVTKSIIARVTGGPGVRFFVNGNRANADSTIASTYNIIVGGSTDVGYRAKGTAGTTDFNNYYADTINFEVAASYNDFADYRAANETLDASSITTDPQIDDVQNGDFSLNAASPALALGAGLERPDVTYTAVPSDVALAAL
jgi:hypothetical protein